MAKKPKQNDLLSVSEAARYLQVPESTVLKLCSALLCVRRSDLERWLAARKVEPTHAS